jgi:hypothetical protein
MSDARMVRVTALLASGPGKPEGDTRCGIEIELCLTPAGQPDSDACSSTAPWRARRFWRNRPDWRGYLVQLDTDRWGMRGSGDPDEPVWEIRGRVFRPGEYLMLLRPNGDELSFRIVSVEG